MLVVRRWSEMRELTYKGESRGHDNGSMGKMGVQALLEKEHKGTWRWGEGTYNEARFL